MSSMLRRAAFVVGILLAFSHFSGPSLAGHFNADDPMNIYYYWSNGWTELVKNLALFFTTYGRPVGGIYYSVLYGAFGLNPLPYHIVLLALLLLNMWLAYRLCTMVTGLPLAGGLTALALTYHAELFGIYFLPSFIFDVLCFTFYVGTLVFYIGRRKRGEPFTTRRWIVFLLLYMGALGSKEMAVTLPVALLLYEAICRPGRVRDAIAPLGALSAMTVVYVVGKTLGPGTLTQMVEYRPQLSWDLFTFNTTFFVKTILYQKTGQFWQVVLLATLLLLAALGLRRRDFVWLWTLTWLTPLPIAFLPGRGGALLYLPLFAWGALFGGLLALVIQAISSRLPKVVGGVVSAILVAGIGVAWWAKTEHQNRYLGPSALAVGELTWKAIQQACAITDIRPGSRVYVENDAFEGWDSKFILELCWGDHTVSVTPGSRLPLPPDQVAQMDHVFTFEDGSLRRVR